MTLTVVVRFYVQTPYHNSIVLRLYYLFSGVLVVINRSSYKNSRNWIVITIAKDSDRKRYQQRNCRYKSNSHHSLHLLVFSLAAAYSQCNWPLFLIFKLNIAEKNYLLLPNLLIVIIFRLVKFVWRIVKDIRLLTPNIKISAHIQKCRLTIC